MYHWEVRKKWLIGHFKVFSTVYCRYTVANHTRCLDIFSRVFTVCANTSHFLDRGPEKLAKLHNI